MSGPTDDSTESLVGTVPTSGVLAEMLLVKLDAFEIDRKEKSNGTPVMVPLSFGIAIAKDGLETAKILSVSRMSEAWKAGLRAGDTIISLRFTSSDPLHWSVWDCFSSPYDAAKVELRVRSSAGEIRSVVIGPMRLLDLLQTTPATRSRDLAGSVATSD